MDIEDCLKSMQETPHGRKRKILLASAIADSSVTIPNVGCVIDTCRALEVRWNSKRSRYLPSTVWASQAICDQRRGRTGRTCSGKVFRLVYQNFYLDSMEKYEQSQLVLASCRDEVLSLLSSNNKVMSDPKALMKRCIDPPPEVHVDDAIQYLKDVKAIREASKFLRMNGGAVISDCNLMHHTHFSIVIHSYPHPPSHISQTKADSNGSRRNYFSATIHIDEGGVIIHGAKAGLLHEALALVSIKSTRPQPIVNAFGNDDSNRLNLSRYFPSVEMKDPKSVSIAHLALKQNR